MEGDLRDRIDNALAMLEAEGLSDLASARRQLALAVETLRAARAGIMELDAQLDAVTAPERDAAAEVVNLRAELQAAVARGAELERQLTDLRVEREIEARVHDEERKRLAELERRAKDFDDVLTTDADAFSKFMDKALDEHDAKKKKR